MGYDFQENRFVEFKIYISLKLLLCFLSSYSRLQNSKFTYLSNKEKLKSSTRHQFVEFKIYISLKHSIGSFILLSVCRIQNLHISQTGKYLLKVICLFVEFKIYISLKRYVRVSHHDKCLQNSKFTYLSNLKLRFRVEILNLGIKKWTDTDPGPKAIQIKSLFELECKF